MILLGMSQWRHEASKQLPELQGTISSDLVHTPASLWIELAFQFDRLCHEDPPPTELLSRIWQYARWSLAHEDEGVQEAVISHFFTNIEDTRCHRAVLPEFMSRQEYEQVTDRRAPQVQ